MKLNQTKTNGLFAYAMPIDDKEADDSIRFILHEGGGWAGGAFSRMGHRYAAIHGLYSWYVDRDLAAAKQWFYLAAKLIAVSTTKPVGYSTLWTCHDFMYPLLSDSPEMIALYGTLETPNLIKNRDKPKEGEFQSHLVQTAIKGDDEQLKQLIDCFAKKGGKGTKGINAYYVQFYNGLLNGDINEMEVALAFLGKFRSVDPTTKDFFAFHAVVLCKLAWLRGHEVQVDSPLVPMAFMPVAPLPEYDDIYAFLKPGWQAPPPPPEYASGS